MKLNVTWASRPCKGEKENGDAVFVRQSSARSVFAVIDALGHGPPAAHAARAALEFLETSGEGQTATQLLNGIHTALRGTRGAAAMLCVYQRGMLEAAGVGNVAFLSFGTRLDVVPVPGILGYRLRTTRSTSGRLVPGTRIVVFSDGIPQRADLRPALERRDERACDRILRECSVPHDDATVLVAEASLS